VKLKHGAFTTHFQLQLLSVWNKGALQNSIRNVRRRESEYMKNFGRHAYCWGGENRSTFPALCADRTSRTVLLPNFVATSRGKWSQVQEWHKQLSSC